MLQVAMANRCGPNYQRAVRERLRHSSINFSRRQRSRRAHCRTGVPKRYLVRIHQPQEGKSKIAHGPGGGTNVEWIPNIHKHHAQPTELCWNRQAFYSTVALTKAIFGRVGIFVDQTYSRKPSARIGMGERSPVLPSHTTGHAGPHPAVRRVELGHYDHRRKPECGKVGVG